MDSAKKSKSATRSADTQTAGLQPATTVMRQTEPRLQAAATRVSSPQDADEKEADSTAQKVMRMAIPQSTVSLVNQGGRGIFRQIAQRKAANEEQPIQRAAAPNDREKIQRQAKLDELKRQAEKPDNIQRKAIPEQQDIKRKAAAEENKLQRKEEEPKIQRKASATDELQRKATPTPTAGSEEKIQRSAEGTPNVSSSVSAEIRNRMAGGEELPLSVRRFMEPRFNADFSKVRIHTDQPSAQLNRQVSARAFTVSNHVFFGRDQFQPDSDDGKNLIAHELTHTIQQGGATQGDSNNPPGPPARNEQVQRSPEPRVETRSEPRVQRLGIRDALDYFAERAHNIPGFRMFTIVLGVNPINMSSVERSPANILRAVVEFIPGGNLITRALDNHGVFDRVGHWVSQQIHSLAITGAAIRTAINTFLDSLSWRDIFDLGGVWQRARSIFTEPISRIRSFVGGLVDGILQFIKDAILRPLAVLASRTSGWDLLCAVLGQNPITGDPVPRNADTLIGGFMTLIGQQEVWNNIKRANAVGRAWGWFQGALNGLMSFVSSIPTLFISTFRSLGIRDLLDVPGAFARVARVFAGAAGRFFSWAGAQVMQLMQIIFEVVAPGAMPYIHRAAGAFQSIIRNPVGFLGNLVQAGRLGFQLFATNFMTHLRTSLIQWLTGAMAGAGIYIPQGFTLPELIKFVLSVLGLTWQNIRQRLVRVVGERAVAAMEAGFELIRTLITEGPAAAWQQISEGLSNLREMVIEQVMNFVRNRIVQAAITRLVSMLSPVGAFIQAIIGIYNTVMFFVERLRTIMQVAMSFVDSIAAIAAGRLSAAAQRVETTMAGMLTLVISFLARFVGLGRVADAVTNIINRVRAPINRALDRVVDWIVTQARRLGRFIAQAGVPQDPNERLRLASRAAVAAASRLRGNRVTAALLNPILAGIRTRYGLTSIVPFERGGSWWVRAAINPVTEEDLRVPTEATAGAGSNYQPIISRLSSAIQMYDLFNTRDPSPVFTNMLTALRQAKTTAEGLHAQRSQNKTEQQMRADRTALQSQLQQIRGIDPNYELISIGEMSLTLNNNTERMSPVINVPAFEPSDRDADYLTEYRRQLREQQDGINAMMAFQWKDNRDRYTSSGRSAVGASMQQTFGTRTGAGRSQGTAAPHNPDQIAGGYADPVGIPAVSRVNSSIGPSWRSRVGAIETRVNGLSPAKRQKTQMSVTLQLA